MLTIKAIWKRFFNKSKIMLLFLFISSAVFALSIIPMLLQKNYLESVSGYISGEVSYSKLLVVLILFYIARCITGGFLTPLGHTRDLYYEYAITKNSLLSQHKHSNKLCLEQYESPILFNIISRAKAVFTSGALKEIVATLGSILTLVISLATLIITLAVFNIKYGVLALISVLPCFYEQLVFAKKYSKLKKHTIELKRRQEQSITHITSKQYLLETKVAGAGNYFRQQWLSLHDDIAQKETKLEKYKLKVELITNLVKSVFVILIIALAFQDLTSKLVSIGTFSAVLSILAVLHGSTNYFISRIGSLAVNYAEVKDTLQYFDLAIEPEKGEILESIDSIELNKVSFSYPNQNAKALKDISTKINKGEKIAILGSNGAGKTTLIKLMLGFYKPDSGSVKINGKDIGLYSKPQWYKKLSSVFQDFQVYNLTIAENICFGSEENEAVAESLNLAGFDLKKHHQKSFIGKEFGGVELSRGQSQQVAIARVYYNKHADIVVIDEPTAALDPLAEQKLYAEFINVMKNKTAFIISHRLSSVKMADRVLVLENGQLIEQGSHEQLVKLNKQYAQMYEAQASLYK